MYDQPRYEPLEMSDLLPGQPAARPQVQGTVPRTHTFTGDVSYYGESSGGIIPAVDSGVAARASNPDFGQYDRNGNLPGRYPTSFWSGVGAVQYLLLPLSRAGRRRQGMIVKRGFPPPPSLPCRPAPRRPLGHFYHVITHGHGAMYSYASRIPPEDRWAIVAYIRAPADEPARQPCGRAGRGAHETGDGEGTVNAHPSLPQAAARAARPAPEDRDDRRPRRAGVCVPAWMVSPERFFLAYLTSFMFWVGISVACLAVIMLHHLVGGIWGFLVRRPAEAVTMTIPLMAVLFIPIALGVPVLYSRWADPSLARANEVVAHKAAYLNVSFFLVRAAIYFGSGPGWPGCSISAPGSRTATTRPNRPDGSRLSAGPAGALLHECDVRDDRLGDVAGAGLLLVDLQRDAPGRAGAGDPGGADHRRVVAGGRRAAEGRGAARGVQRSRQPAAGLHDALGLHLVLAVPDHLDGNLPEEVPWYTARVGGGWRRVATSAASSTSSLPFLLLLVRKTKRQAADPGACGVVIMVMRLVDMFWLWSPGLHHGEFHFHWLDLAAPIGIGGIWLAVFFWQLKGAPSLVPANAPLNQGRTSWPLRIKIRWWSPRRPRWGYRLNLMIMCMRNVTSIFARFCGVSSPSPLRWGRSA